MTRKLGVFVMLALAPVTAWSITQEAYDDSAVKADESVAEKDEPVVTPSPWAARKYAVGIGYSGSTLYVDVPRDGSRPSRRAAEPPRDAKEVSSASMPLCRARHIPHG